MVLGALMIIVVAVVMFKANPPYADAAAHMVWPEHPVALVLPIITLVGGTVGVILPLPVHTVSWIQELKVKIIYHSLTEQRFQVS